jgi:hypothetical protein
LSSDDSSIVGGALKIRNLYAGESRCFVFAQGDWSLDVDQLNWENEPLEAFIQMSGLGANAPERLNLGGNVKSAESVLAESSSADMEGSTAQRSDNSSASVSLSAGDEITAAQVQNRTQHLSINSGVGTGTITLGSTPLPAPLCRGDTLTLWVVTSRNSVSFPASANNEAFTLDDDVIYRLINISGKWKLYLYA